MKKIFVALSMVAFLAACDDASSASAGPNDEPGVEASSSSSEKVTEPDEVTSSSSSVDPISSSSLQGDKNFSSSSVASSSNSAGNVITYGTMTDSRDGQIYKTVTIGTQTWMAENLNYAYTDVPCNYIGYTSDSTSWCYDNDPANCTKYGRLYTWAAAMDSVGTWSNNGKGCGYGSTCSPTLPVRGICPEGWHLPTKSEFETLFTAVGGQSTAGKVLKSQTGWYGSGNGTNAFGFSALPAGNRFNDGSFYSDGNYAYFWSSTEYNSYFAYYIPLHYSYDNAYLRTNDKYLGFSVRCVKD